MAKKIDELNKLYAEGEEADQKVWAEMRSNLLLVSGDHYSKTSSKFHERIRDNKDISSETKVRLTRNHIQRLSKIYVNAITSLAPGVIVEPANPKELQDQKSAQMHNSVLEFMKNDQNLKAKVRDFAEDYVKFGECAVKVYWDWQKGEFLGYGKKPKLDDSGNEILDENGQIVEEDDEKSTIWSGSLVHERLYGFNLFRPKACQDLRDSEWIGIRKMAVRKDIEQLVADDEDKMKALSDASSKGTYMVFDIHKASYEMSKDQIMLREIYYKPSPQYPNGYFYIFTQAGILFEGELPFRKFPIVWQGFDMTATSARAISPIKTWKPYQIEINRAASKMAEHQITLGDDKIVVSNNAKISSAGTAPGLRAYSTSGPAVPVYLPGRTGDQYLPYLEQTVKELYEVALVAEILEDKPAAQVDAYAMLLQSAKWKKKFSLYAEKFEDFLIRWHTLALDLFREYATEETVIKMVGSSERVNISEFKNSSPLCYQINLDAASDDVESRMGRQLSLNHIIQYAGNSMDKNDLGKLFRHLPYLDNEEMMSDLTMDYDNATNDILALERGDIPIINQFDNHTYVVQRLTKRMREADFKFLDPNIQNNFEMVRQQHEQMEVQKQQAIQRAEQGFIPTTGYLVSTQVYAPDPNNPKQTKPLRLPYDAIAWLAKQLEAQGMGPEQLKQMSDAALGQLSQSIPSQAIQQPSAMMPRQMGE